MDTLRGQNVCSMSRRCHVGTQGFTSKPTDSKAWAQNASYDLFFLSVLLRFYIHTCNEVDSFKDTVAWGLAYAVVCPSAQRENISVIPERFLVLSVNQPLLFSFPSLWQPLTWFPSLNFWNHQVCSFQGWFLSRSITIWGFTHVIPLLSSLPMRGGAALCLPSYQLMMFPGWGC